MQLPAVQHSTRPKEIVSLLARAREPVTGRGPLNELVRPGFSNDLERAYSVSQFSERLMSSCRSHRSVTSLKSLRPQFVPRLLSCLFHPYRISERIRSTNSTLHWGPISVSHMRAVTDATRRRAIGTKSVLKDWFHQLASCFGRRRSKASPPKPPAEICNINP